MKPWLLLSLSSVLASLALAAEAAPADKPVFAPAPDWVKPAPPDLTPAKGSAGAAVAVLLSDTQSKLTAQGEATYVELVATAQAPQGLQTLGAINIPWRPDTDRLIVHKVHILRAGKVIDALTTGPGFTTLRRETKLEQAAIDGTLTAAMQIEGLQVGDTLDLAYTIERADPILRGRLQEDFVANGGPIAHLRVRALWPTALNVKTLDSDLGPALKIQPLGDMTEATLALDDTEPFQGPKMAPTRFLRGREFEVSNFATWAEVAAVLQPLFVEASRIPAGSPLQAEIQKIADQYKGPKARAEAALTLVQDQVRYLYMGLDGGGLKPASADLTWSRRFGDCKGKTALLIGLLKGLGIQAEPALASSALGDGMDARLPMLAQFDHVLVKAVIDGRTYWLDGSRIGDRSLDDIATPAFSFALPMDGPGATLVKLETKPLAVPQAVTTVKLDASAGLDKPAPAHIEVVFTGDAATVLNLQFSNLAPADRDRALRQYWSSQYDFIKVTAADAKYDPKTGQERFVMDGSATMDWSYGYEVDGSTVGWKDDLTRTPGPHADAPFAIAPTYERREETIVLPNKGAGYAVNGTNIDETVGGTAMSRHASIKDGVFTMQVSEKSVATEFPASEASAVAKRMKELAKMRLFVAQPAFSAPTAEQTKTTLGLKPTTADQYIQRGSARIDSGAFADALTDLAEALKLDPESITAMADTAVAYAWLGQPQKARAAAESVLKREPDNVVANHALGLVAEKAGHWDEAARSYSAALMDSPNDVFALTRRAYVYLRLKEPKKALADSDAVLAITPNNPSILLLQAGIYMSQTDPDRALAALDTLAAAGPADAATKTQMAQARKAAQQMKVALEGWRRDLKRDHKDVAIAGPSK